MWGFRQGHVVVMQATVAHSRRAVKLTGAGMQEFAELTNQIGENPQSAY